MNSIPTKNELFRIRRKSNRFFRRFHDRKPSNFKTRLVTSNLGVFYHRFSDTV